MSEQPVGPMIRLLNDEEKRIRDKYRARVREAELGVQRALQEVTRSKEALNDILLSFNGGRPCTLKQDVLHEVAGNGA